MLSKIKFLKLAKYHIIALILMPIILIGAFLLAINNLTATAEETTITPSGNESLIDDLNKQIDEQRKKLDELVDKIDEYKSNTDKLKNQASNLKNQIYILDNQIAKAELDVKAKNEEIKVTELEIQKVELQITDNEKLIAEQKKYLSAFIRLLDYYDDKDYLLILLNNNSFSEFFDQVNNIEGIEEDLQKALNRFQEMVEKFNQQKKELSDKRDQLSSLMDKLENQKDILAEQIETKQQLISETNNSEKKYQNLIGDLKQEELAANNAIAALERKLRQELEKKGDQEKFNTLGDVSMIWPMDGRRITVYFRDPDYPYRNLFEHSGLDIGLPSGTPIKAAEAGYVAKIGINTKWYGTYIMIIHNNNLATLYAHLRSANVSVDQYVSQGQVIAASDNTGFSSGPHLHFEVRLNGIPVNPLTYLP
ncbi:MAG: hypothetical protein A3A02_04940 [Candidatus Buchananbacteria bacterium RIFCSPLOWO2_01_FULL_39_33]|uniref:M23ase beta-sheet core domain-containing protein n=1 Tax=Candidatus Buchananbacteria bacterium RIFCSPLOWO2_01_FULL_39_33 TaxID=1797543 RepID=A0A1G1YLE4_9BACT|nr:MAG: hypothetical protein A3A02_04940 [Candidatus Buchananbacteria bacterium RIFCSPLOWO2_01_FULL_39_33]